MSVENILLVTIDSLRSDYRSEDAPTLTRLADRGTSFTNVFATGPGTTPSFPSILTGSYPLSYGGLGVLSDDRPFLARNLRDHGITTAGFHSNPFLSANFNYDTGFDAFEDHQDQLIGIAAKLFPQGVEKSILPNPVATVLKKSYELIQDKPRPYKQAETITDDAIRWLCDTSDGFFEWVHYMDVHHPCFPPKHYLQQYELENTSYSEISDLYSRALDAPETVTDHEDSILRESYRASLQYVDDQLGRLVKALDESGQADETLLIVTSDHGQLFGEFGAYGKPHRLYDALISVPLVMQNTPKRISGYSDELFSLIDLPPFIHRALQLPVPDEYEGKCPIEADPRDDVFAEHQLGDDFVAGIRSGEWKFVVDGLTNESRAYRVSSPIEEQIPLTQSGLPSDLRNKLTERLKSVDISAAQFTATINSETEGRLQDLGYL